MVHSDVLIFAYCPGAHAEHTTPPSVGWWCPAVHSTQAIAPLKLKTKETWNRGEGKDTEKE